MTTRRISTASVPPAELLDVQDVARMLNVPRRWVYERAARGELPSGRFGKYLRFRHSDVLEYRDRHFTT